MKHIPDHLLQEGTPATPGYAKIISLEDWCVATLTCFDRTRPGLFEKVERHLQTPEVFVLTEGCADLIVCSGDESPEEIFVRPMERSRTYCIPAGVWHHVVMSENAYIVLFEKCDTSAENSEYHYFSSEKKESIRTLFSI